MEFDWEKKYNIGIETIDNEHRLFLSLIKKLKNAKGPEEENLAFDELIRYIRYHFTSEETLMDFHNYSQIEIHKLAHLKFLDKITTFQSGIEMGAYIYEELLDFLGQWFISHSTKMDKHFSKELNGIKKNTGSSFDDFLIEEGIYDEVVQTPIKESC